MAGVPLPKLRAESRPDSSAGCSQQQLPELLEAAKPRWSPVSCALQFWLIHQIAVLYL